MRLLCAFVSYRTVLQLTPSLGNRKEIGELRLDAWEKSGNTPGGLKAILRYAFVRLPLRSVC